MSRLSTSMRMSTRSELLSGVTILSASLLLRAISGAGPVGLFRDLLGVFSVLFLFAGIGVVAVGLAHRVLRAKAEGSLPHPATPMPSETAIAIGAVIGVGIGSTVGAMYPGALPVAIGTAIGAATGVALATRWDHHQHGTR